MTDWSEDLELSGDEDRDPEAIAHDRQFYELDLWSRSMASRKSFHDYPHGNEVNRTRSQLASEIGSAVCVLEMSLPQEVFDDKEIAFKLALINPTVTHLLIREMDAPAAFNIMEWSRLPTHTILSSFITT